MLRLCEYESNMRKEFRNSEKSSKIYKVQIKSCHVQKTSLVIQKHPQTPQTHVSVILKRKSIPFEVCLVGGRHFGWSWRTVTTQNGTKKQFFVYGWLIIWGHFHLATRICRLLQRSLPSSKDSKSSSPTTEKFPLQKEFFMFTIRKAFPQGKKKTT